MFYNRDTGEVFETKREAVRDAVEQYDYGDPTNPVTWDDLPYIEIEDKQWDALVRAFG